MATYAPIFLNAEPSLAMPGDTVYISSIITNNLSGATPLYGELAIEYGGQTYSVTYDTPQVDTVDPGYTLLIEGHFVMPNAAVVVTARSYYWNDSYWVLDDTKTFNVRLNQWSQIASKSVSVPLSLTGQWTKIASKSVSIPLSVTAQWKEIAVTTVSIPLSLSGQWTKIASTSISIPLSLIGQWSKLAVSSVSIGLKLPLSISTSSLADGVINTAYSKTLMATGGTPPYTWSIGSGTLPAGLTLSPAGVIAGKPTAAGNPVSIAFKVTDSKGATASKVLSITIKAQPPASQNNWLLIAGAAGAVAVVGGVVLATRKKKPAVPTRTKEVAGAVSSR